MKKKVFIQLIECLKVVFFNVKFILFAFFLTCDSKT